MSEYLYYLYVCIINCYETSMKQIGYNYFSIGCCVNYYRIKFEFQNQVVCQEIKLIHGSEIDFII
jgi:hypothetical protein